MYAVSQFLHADYGKKKFQTWTLKLPTILVPACIGGGGGAQFVWDVWGEFILWHMGPKCVSAFMYVC